jgi:2-succinyl-6-hydroxy-2,4-cyclohexadiene-1-carboxylate synthase
VAVTGRVLAMERSGQGPALMLLHGFTGNGRSMAGIARAFERDFDTIAPDLPGHGRSLHEPHAAAYDFAACLDDLVATLESADHRRAHWLGYSMGARLALACAVRHPDRVASLILVAGRAGIADAEQRTARRRADELLAARIEERGVAAFLDEWLAQPLFATLQRLGPEFMACEREARLANDARALAASLRGLGPGAQPPLFDALPRVNVPVLLVAGALDERFVAAAYDLAGRLPQSEVHVIPDAGHAAHVEQPEAFLRLVHEFLSRARRPASSFPPHSVQEIAS